MTTSERPDQEPETPSQEPETLSQQPPSQPFGGTGRLAQVIATRGGLAPPEAPFVIEHREALIYMLCEAAELEHGIMCQYLFAAFSLKQDEGEGLTEAELAAARRWRKVISHVATQEMLHLALVQNLLSAIGAAPHLTRPNFPHPASHYPAGVHLALLPFGEEAMRHFMFLERPEGMDIRDADGMAAYGRAQPLMESGDIVPRGQDFKTVGHMYRSIEAGFRHLVAKHGEDWLFVGPPRAQATPEYFGWPELVPVTDLASAQRAIDEILEQGEGPRGAWQEAHFGQFVEVLDEYLQAKEANLGLEATRPVQTVNVRPCDRDVEVPLVSDTVTGRVMDLFNVAYEILLAIFERFFAHTDESDAQLRTLADTTVGLMVRVIKPLGDLITTLPAGAEYPGQTAGPSFELFYESDYLLPHRDAAWALMAERLDVAAGFAQEIIIGDTGAGGPILTPEQVAAGAGDPVPASERVAAVIEPVGAALAGLAGALAAFLPPSDPHSPAATGPDSVRTAASADPDLAALAARANDFHLTGPDGLRPGDLTADLAQDIEQAWLITSELLAPGSRADRHWAAARLVDSVLRPLADTLRATTTTQPAPSAPANANPATANPAGADERIWQLAQDVTRQHVRWAQAGTAPAGLAEATAGLQGIACDLAPGADRRAAFRELQAALPTGIQVAPDGPYLVTNVATVHDYLGQDVPVPPQLALCRCGASGRKPFCDGSHAASGFTGDKDPKRVPDHRDRYDGEQVTVFDNRGICQHSGFCTDRLSAVFRTDAEPFVAPSGGRMDEIIRAVRDCPSGALGLALDGREQRDLADWHGDRPAVIEISKDGPYRVTGGITLTGPRTGPDEPRAEGASREHYALCRCGHSQNKPFCSGMHWYIGFSHPDVAPGRVPSLFEWAGGLPALTQLTRRLYEKLIPADPQLAAVFADIPPGYPEREAARIAAAFGAPTPATAQTSDAALATDLTVPPDQQARWVALAVQAAGEVGLPADPEFRAAVTAFFTWYAGGALADRDGAALPAWAAWDWSGRPSRYHHAAGRRGGGRARHPARARRAGEFRDPHQADVPGQRPAVHAVRARPVVLR